MRHPYEPLNTYILHKEKTTSESVKALAQHSHHKPQAITPIPEALELWRLYFKQTPGKPPGTVSNGEDSFSGECISFECLIATRNEVCKRQLVYLPLLAVFGNCWLLMLHSI